ncbi:MAG: phospholipase D-like domain-containing protein [Planctomycetota bacterium]
MRLQPPLRPTPIWLRRILLVSTLAAGLLVLGLLAPGRPRPPRLLLTAADAGEAYLPTVAALIDTAETRIWVALYVLRLEPDDPQHPVTDLCHRLAAAAERGVDVRVVLDAGNDWRTGEPDPKHELPATWLRNHGIRVTIDSRDRTTHLKVLLIDTDTTIVGSHNWTAYALTRNREASTLSHDPTVAHALEQHLLSIPGFPVDEH